MPFIEDKTGYFRDAIDELHRLGRKHDKLKSDLRNLVEELKAVQDIYPGLHNVIARIEKLIGGESDAKEN